MIAYVVRIQKAVRFHKQQRRIQGRIVISLGKTLQFLFPAPLQHIPADEPGLLLPALLAVVFAQHPGDSGPSVQSYPAHHFGGDEMALLAPDFPDSLVGLAPLLHDVGLNLFHQLPHILDLVQRSRDQAVVLVDQVHQITERVVLPLMVGVVADAYGLRAFVAAQMLENRFRQLPLSADAVHDLERVPVGGKGGLNETHEALRHAGVTHFEKRLDGHGRVAQPAEAVIPVTHLAHRLGQAGGEGCQHGSVVIGHQLQCQQAPFDHVVVESVFFRPVAPVEPVDQRPAVFQLFPFDVYRNYLLVIGKQKEFVFLEYDLPAPLDVLQRNRRVEVLPVRSVQRAVAFDIFRPDITDGLSPGIVRSRSVMDPKPGNAPDTTYVAVELGRKIVFAVLGPIVGHEIQYRELGLVRNEVRGENIRVRNVGLLGAVRFGYLEAEAPSLLAVQQGCEDRRRVELGQAEPFDVSCFRYQGGRAAVAYDPVIESMVHGETRFIGFSFATAFLRSGSPSVRAFCGTAPKRPVLFRSGSAGTGALSPAAACCREPSPRRCLP